MHPGDPAARTRARVRARRGLQRITTRSARRAAAAGASPPGVRERTDRHRSARRQETVPSPGYSVEAGFCDLAPASVPSQATPNVTTTVSPATPSHPPAATKRRKAIMLARAHTFTIEGLQTRPVSGRGRHPRGAAGVHDRRPRRRRGARGARPRAGGDPELGLRVSDAQDHREPRSGRRAEDRPRPGPRAGVRGARPRAASCRWSGWRAMRSSASWRSTARCARATGRSRSRRRRYEQGLRTLVLAPARAREAALVEHLRSRPRGACAARRACSRAARATHCPQAQLGPTRRARARAAGRADRIWRTCAVSARLSKR